MLWLTGTSPRKNCLTAWKGSKVGVLFLNHPESDYGGAMLFTGLCEALGAEHVYDFPLKLSYHGTTHTYTLPSGDPGVTCPLPWSGTFPREHVIDNVERINDLLTSKFFDFVVLESLRVDAVHAFDFFSGMIRSSNTPVVIADGEDSPHIPWRELRRIQPKIFLKRELINNGELYKPSADSTECGIRIVGFPFSAPSSAIDQIEREEGEPWRVVFSAGNTYKLRQEVASAILKRYGNDHVFVALSPDNENRLSGFENPGLLPWEKYIARLKNALVGVCVRGFGWDTVRFWETAYTTTLVADKTPLMYANPYVSGETAFIYDCSPEDCIRKIDEALSNLEASNRIGSAGIEHTRTHHTNKARAEMLLNMI